jgi:hypothetical protein
MQSPLETSVQVLRNTRRVEEVCAWTTIGTQFPLMPLMSGVTPKRRDAGFADAARACGRQWHYAIQPDRDRAVAMNP